MAGLASAPAMLGFCIGPQRARVEAQDSPSLSIPLAPCSCSHHGADVLCIFCPSSSIGRGACVCMGASSTEGLPGFGDAAEDPEDQTPVLREVAPSR